MRQRWREALLPASNVSFGVSPHATHQPRAADALIAGDEPGIEAHGGTRDQVVEGIDETHDATCVPSSIARRPATVEACNKLGTKTTAHLAFSLISGGNTSAPAATSIRRSGEYLPLLTPAPEEGQDQVMRADDPLSMALVELKRDDVIRHIENRIAAGERPLALLESCRQGMALVGERFQQGDYFLAELLLAAEIFKAAASLIEPHLGTHPAAEAGVRIVLATMKGDIHDLGKNIVATLLRAHGFEVHDLGVDVPPDRLLQAVREIRPGIVGFSALLTTAFHSMKEATALLKQAGLRDRLKVIVGGGVTTPAVKEYVGAEFQTTDATQGVAYCLEVRKERGHDTG